MSVQQAVRGNRRTLEAGLQHQQVLDLFQQSTTRGHAVGSLVAFHAGSEEAVRATEETSQAGLQRLHELGLVTI